MPWRTSYWALILLLLAAGWFLFEIVAPLLPPLFLAAVLALLFRPAYESIARWFGGRHDRIAAVITTFLILAAVILPVAVALTMAGREVMRLGQSSFVAQLAGIDQDVQRDVARLRELLTDEQYETFSENIRRGISAGYDLSVREDSQAARLLAKLSRNQDVEGVQQAVAGFDVRELADPQESPWLERTLQPFERYMPEGAAERIKSELSLLLSQLLRTVYGFTRNLLTNLLQLLIGFVVMAISLYYFLADGPRLLDKLKRLLPIESRDGEALIQEFTLVCRAVVFATLVAAIVQGILVGLGLWISGVGQAFLLGSLTVICSLVPFIGAAAVYLPAAVYLAVTGSYGWAIFLLFYGWIIVSSSDNLVRMYVVGEQSHLHPLAVLITALGGLQLVGILGIFIGPLAAALFYALLKIVHARILETEGKPPEERLVVPP